MHGHCLLTGKLGFFVKSHILPRALTKPEIEGGILYQAGDGEKPQKRRTSWYDYRICTAEGEEFLAELDDFAIKELRRLRLIWSGFGPVKFVKPDYIIEYIDGDELEPKGVRIVEFLNQLKLERWFASLLWRAAVSKLPEMKDVSLNSEKLAHLADFILEGKLDNPFPISLIQLNTIGSTHNQSPTAETTRPTNSLPLAPWRVFRFYFEGLIVHFQRDEDSWTRMGKLVLGRDKETAIVCIPYIASFQAERLSGIIAETFQNYPNGVPRPKGSIQQG